jgi:transcriptional regulator with XRE-family HTH domain
LNDDSGEGCMHKRAPKLSVLLKSFREANGYTQDDICEILEIEKSTLSRWENGLAKPTGREMIDKIKRFYSISTEEMQVLFLDWNSINGETGSKIDYKILGYQSLDFLELSEEQLIERLIEIDYSTMAGINSDQVGSVDQWAHVIKASPFTWRVLVFGEEVVGYWHYICLNDETFQKAKTGVLKEAEINVENIVIPYNLDKDKLYNMYIVALAIDRKHQDPINGGKFILSFVNDIRRLAEGGIFFSEACTVAHTVDGYNICKHFSFREIGRQKVASDGQIAEVFHITGEDIAKENMKADPKLSRLYQRRFLES